jgi:KDO2-lipid IV(A) lauroyltransferase
LDFNKEDILKYVKCDNIDLLNKYYNEGKSVQVVVGHYGNWEWIIAYAPQLMKHASFSIYKPLHNKHFDRFMYKLRSKFGGIPVPMQQTLRYTLDYKNKNIPTATGILSDQCPTYKEINHWTHFLNRETPVYIGAEKIAKKFDMAVVFIHMKPIRPGYYELIVLPVTENPKGMQPGKITDKHTEILEKIIREEPQYWLWTHKRWKRNKEEWKRRRNIQN